MVLKYIKRLSCMLLLVSLIMGMNMTAFAASFSEIDFNRRGSVSITLQDKKSNKAISGVSFKLYSVGDIECTSDNPEYSYNKDFSASEMVLQDIQKEELAEYLAKYASEKKISGITKETDNQGKVEWTQLDLGLYLVVQTERVQGEFETKPFLVSVPFCEGDDADWTYDIDASPKMEIVVKDTPKPDKPKNPSLIQTGQLNWPIPVLAGVGVVVSLLAGQ